MFVAVGTGIYYLFKLFTGNTLNCPTNKKMIGDKCIPFDEFCPPLKTIDDVHPICKNTEVCYNDTNKNTSTTL